jgi:hypothetical protein
MGNRASEAAMRAEIGDAVSAALVTFASTLAGGYVAKVDRVSDTHIHVTTRGGETLSVVVGKFKR